jgi:hypothetical protein
MLDNPTPIINDPVPAKVFNKLHVFSLSATQPSVSSGAIHVGLLPATESGELADQSKLQMISCQLHPAMEEVPELAAAFAAVLAAIPATQQWLAAQSAQPPQLEQLQGS